MEMVIVLIALIAAVALILSIVALGQLSGFKKENAKLRKKVKQLDPQKIAKEAIINLKELPKDIQEQIRGIIQSKTKNLNDRLEKNEKETEAQKEKLENLRSKIKENGRKVVKGIFDVLEEVFGPIPKEKPEVEETPDDKEAISDEQVPADEGKTVTDESEAKETSDDEVPESKPKDEDVSSST